MPQRRVAGTIGVEGVDAVVLGGDEENIVRAFAWNFDVRHEKRLSVDGSIDFERADLAEALGIDFLGSENLLVESGTGARVVVLRGGDLGSAKRSQGKEERGEAVGDRFHLVPPKSDAILDAEGAGREAGGR